ncbi:MAG TPA: gluconokinase [Pyrinomonadaceae bacterium]|nr:gluconokinase [Pyrinomonadaceae bacterium]
MFVVLMGVAGSGKTTIGRALAAELGWKFYDADDFHPPASVAKMARGIPLEDADRLPWLEKLGALVRDCLAQGESAALACSALKAAYRHRLMLDERVKLVYLKGNFDLIQKRLARRRGHFMPAAMLESQFAALEEPPAEFHVNIAATPDEIVRAIRLRLGL